MSEQDNARLVSRFAGILAELVNESSFFVRLCEAGRRMVEADDAALTIAYAERGRVTVSATHPTAAALQDLQTVTGEGPTIDAVTTGGIVVASLDPGHLAQWPLLSQQIHQLRPRGAVMAIPLIAGGSTLGVPTVHSESPDAFSHPGAAEFVGAALTAAILQDPTVQRPDDVVREVWGREAQVHQATGMIVSQIGVRPQDALALLRGHAFARDMTLLDVAQEIIARQINFRDFTIEGD